MKKNIFVETKISKMPTEIENSNKIKIILKIIINSSKTEILRDIAIIYNITLCNFLKS